MEMLLTEILNELHQINEKLTSIVENDNLNDLSNPNGSLLVAISDFVGAVERLNKN